MSTQYEKRILHTELSHKAIRKETGPRGRRFTMYPCIHGANGCMVQAPLFHALCRNCFSLQHTKDFNLLQHYYAELPSEIPLSSLQPN
uniref:Uncharacterized protein n=2 Tax=Lepeophtheirus salmonis TaxID=72036 RepID=A0A0K2TDN7_LEPSM